MTFDLQRILESKVVHRRLLASRPIAEKLRVLDALREREVGIRRGKSRPDDDSIIVVKRPRPSP